MSRLAMRFESQAQIIEQGRKQALEGITEALREGDAELPREHELVRQVANLDKTVTSLAIQERVFQQAADTGNTRPRKPSG